MCTARIAETVGGSSVDRVRLRKIEQVSPTDLQNLRTTEIRPAVLLIDVRAIDPDHVVEIRDGSHVVRLSEGEELIKNFLTFGTSTQDDFLEIV